MGLKVLQISTVCGSGSVGRIVVDIYEALLKNGDKGCIAYGRRKEYRRIALAQTGIWGCMCFRRFLGGSMGLRQKDRPSG